MYLKFADKQGWKTQVLSKTECEAGGYSEIIISIQGDSVYSKLKYESGVHRVQRVPETESGGRIHTSTASVAVIPEAEEVDVLGPGAVLYLMRHDVGAHEAGGIGEEPGVRKTRRKAHPILVILRKEKKGSTKCAK